MYHGEVCESVLEIWNKGAVDACSVRVQFSPPGRIVPLTSPVDLPQTFMPPASSSVTHSAPLAALSSLDIDGAYSHALTAPIPSGGCVRVHILVHAIGDDRAALEGECGGLDLKCGIVYSSPTPPPAVKGKSIRFRLLRLSSHIEIKPLLQASITCRRSSSSPDSNIAAAQLSAHAPCILTQVSCLSSFWSVAPLRAQGDALHTAASSQGLELHPQNGRNLVFRFVPPPPSSTAPQSSPDTSRVVHTIFNLRDAAAHGISDILAGPLLLLYSRRNAEAGSTSVAAAHRLAALMKQV
jgi:hypothetical protein